MPRFEVRTVEWMRDKYAGRLHRVRSPAFSRVRVWPDYCVAAAACDRTNAEAWAEPNFNPFHHGGESLFFQTTMLPGVFCDFLQDHDIELPAAGPDAANAVWSSWWTERRSWFTVDQVLAVRHAMDLVCYAEVVDVPAATSYLVQQRNWSCESNEEEDNGDDEEPWVVADDEGGVFVAAYCDRGAAERRCGELNAEWQASPDYYGFKAFRERDRVGVPLPWTMSMGDTQFFEVVEIEADLPLRGATDAGVCYVLSRHAYRAGEPMSNQSQGPSPSRVALKAFATAAAASSRHSELMRVARRTMNPFACLEHRNSRGPQELPLPWRVPPVPWAWPTPSGELGWYDNEVLWLSDDERAEVWTLFDERPLYGFSEVPLGDGGPPLAGASG